jgi:hypothetical protein
MTRGMPGLPHRLGLQPDLPMCDFETVFGTPARRFVLPASIDQALHRRQAPERGCRNSYLSQDEPLTCPSPESGAVPARAATLAEPAELGREREQQGPVQTTEKYVVSGRGGMQ